MTENYYIEATYKFIKLIPTAFENEVTERNE